MTDKDARKKALYTALRIICRRMDELTSMIFAGGARVPHPDLTPADWQEYYELDETSKQLKQMLKDLKSEEKVEPDIENSEFAIGAYLAVDEFLVLLKNAIPIAELAKELLEGSCGKHPKEPPVKEILGSTRKWLKKTKAMVKRWDSDNDTGKT